MHALTYYAFMYVASFCNAYLLYCKLCINLGGYMYIACAALHVDRNMSYLVSATKNDCSVRSVLFHSNLGFSTTRRGSSIHHLLLLVRE